MDYKKYSLEKLENWIHDAVSCSEATPQEIYDVIKKVVEENYYIYKNHTERCYELLALLNGNGNFKLSEVLAEREYYEGKKDNNKFVSFYKDDPSPEFKKSWNDFWEEHYYPEEAKDNGMRPWGHSDMEYLVSNSKKDKVVKWQLPVEVDGLTGDCFIQFPDDLLEAANLKEGDTITWIDRKDGSFELKKVTKFIGMEEC